MRKKIIFLFPLPIVFVLVFLWVFTFLVPPFQKPDEPLHFKRAFSLAMGQLTCRKDGKYQRGYFTFPVSVDMFPDQMMSEAIIMKPEGKFPLALLKKEYRINLTETTDLQYNCNLPFIGYVPHALGILFSLPLNNLIITFYTARAFGALFFFILFLASYHFVPKRFRSILLLTAFLPMSLQQVTAVSYDCVSISLGLVLFALFTRYLEKKTVSVSGILKFYAILLAFLFTKPGFYFYGLLLLYPIQRLELPNTGKICLSVVLFAGVLGIVWYGMTLPI